MQGREHGLEEKETEERGEVTERSLEGDRRERSEGERIKRNERKAKKRQGRRDTVRSQVGELDGSRG